MPAFQCLPKGLIRGNGIKERQTWSNQVSQIEDRWAIDWSPFREKRVAQNLLEIDVCLNTMGAFFEILLFLSLVLIMKKLRKDVKILQPMNPILGYYI